MIGLGALFNAGMALYSMRQSNSMLNDQKKSMTDINTEISGGAESDVHKEVTAGKFTQPGENYLKMAGNKPPKQKESGLGFGSNSGFGEFSGLS